MWIASVFLWVQHTDQDEEVFLGYAPTEAEARDIGVIEAARRDITDRYLMVYRLTV